jgi:outer membrane receptor protein involved in Fe transport
VNSSPLPGGRLSFRSIPVSLRTISVIVFVFTGVLAITARAAVAAPTDGPQAPDVVVSGRVLDPSGASVAGASVVLEPGAGIRRVTTTDSAGVYAFANVKPGSYVVIVTANGFRPLRSELRVTGTSVARDFTLELQGLEDTVTVRGEALDAVRVEAEATYNRNKAVTTLDQETVIRNSPVANYESLRLLPGVMSAGAKDRFSVPSHLRGAGAWGHVEQVDDYPAINITPVSAEDGGYTASFSSIIPSLALSRLTLATGGLGVSYGQATGGIIKTAIKRGSNQSPRTTLRVEGVGVGEAVLMGDTGGVYRGLDFYVAGQTVYGDYGDTYATHARPLEELRLASGLAKVGYSATPDSRAELLFVGGDESHEYYQLSTEQGTGGSLRRDYHTEKRNYFTAARYDVRPSPNLVLAAGVTHSRFHENRIEDLLNGVAVDLSRRNRPQQATRAVANVDWIRSLTPSIRYTASGGLDMTWDKFRDITTTPLTFEFREQSAYWRNSVALDAGLVINAGLRVSAVDNGFATTHPVLYDAGAAYQLPSGTRLMGSYSTGYKLNKAFYLWWGNGQFIGRPGTEGLRPSRTETAELGIQQEITRGSRSLGVVRLSWYRTDERDLFNFGNTGTGVPFYDDARVRGLEAWSEWRFSKIRPFASFTWLRTERTASTNPAATNIDLRFTPLPNYAASVGAHVDLLDRLSLSAMGYYDDGGVSEQVVTDSILVTRFESFVKANASAAYRWNDRVSLTLRVENLFNQRDLGYSRSILNPDGTSRRVAGTQRDPGTIVGGGLQVRF